MFSRGLKVGDSMRRDAVFVLEIVVSGRVYNKGNAESPNKLLGNQPEPSVGPMSTVYDASTAENQEIESLVDNVDKVLVKMLSL